MRNAQLKLVFISRVAGKWARQVRIWMLELRQNISRGEEKRN